MKASVSTLHLKAVTRTSLEALKHEFTKDEFSYDTGVYRTYVQRMLSLPTLARKESALEFFELLESILDMLVLSFGGGTLSPEERRQVFESVCSAWQDSAPDMLRSAQIGIAAKLIPEPGVREWLLERARTAKSDHARQVILAAANVERQDFQV
jgi:hypothetical protein